MSENMQQCPSCGELVPIEYVTCVWCGFDLTAEHIRRSGIEIGRREAVQRMVKVVRDPFTTFKEITLLPEFTGGRMIFYFIGLAMTLNMLAIFSKIENLDFNGVSGTIASINIGITINIPVRLVLNLAFLIVQPLVLLFIFNIIWRIATRIMSLFARSVGGKGDKNKIRAVIGYSMLPVFFAWALSWPIRLITPSTTASNPNEYGSVERALLEVSEGSIGVVTIVLMWIGWLWATVLGIIGMRNASKLSWAEAVIVAGIPYAVFMSIAI